MLFLALLFVSNLGMAQQDNIINSGSWSGAIINSGCTVDEAFAEAAKCMDAAPGANLVLYHDTIRQIYELDPPTQAAGHLAVARKQHAGGQSQDSTKLGRNRIIAEQDRRVHRLLLPVQIKARLPLVDTRLPAK